MDFWWQYIFFNSKTKKNEMWTGALGALAGLQRRADFWCPLDNSNGQKNEHISCAFVGVALKRCSALLLAVLLLGHS